MLFISIPHVTLIIIVLVLLIVLVSACIKFTTGPANTVALMQQLKRLQAKFAANTLLNPNTEREEMEILQNKLKTTSSPAVISGDVNLKQLFYTNCKSIQAVLSRADLSNRTSWIKLNALMVDFDDLYFKA